MKNTGIEYLSTEKTPGINPAFSELLPPLPDDQYAKLEADMLANGCYAPVILNEDMEIIDGHHRHAICEEHGLLYKMLVFSFEDVLEAQQWALDTQKARRNLSTWELGQIALKLKPALEEKGKETQGARTDLFPKSEKSESANTTKELANMAGIGHDTMNKVIQIDEHAPAPVKEALDDGMSVNKAYQITNQIKNLPEEVREEAAEAAVAMAKADKEEKRLNKVVDDRTKVAKQYCAAFEKSIAVEANEKNVRTWIEWAGIRKGLIKEMIHEAKEISASFSVIAGILETIYEKEAKPYEDEELVWGAASGDDAGDCPEEDIGETEAG